MPTKRTLSPNGNGVKKLKLNSHRSFNDYINFNNNKYYPNSLSLKIANKWNNGSKPKPIELFNKFYKEKPIDSNEKYLVHLFKNDLRIHDNTALYNLVQDAQNIKANPIGVYVISTKFWESHMESAFKLDFIHSNILELKKELSKLNIPLQIVYYDDDNNNDTSTNQSYQKFIEDLLINKFKTQTIYFNLNYEIDELRRDIELIKSEKLTVRAYHDQCIVKPGELKSGKGTQYSKFSPWFKKWDEYLKGSPIEIKEINQDIKFDKWDWSNLPNDEFKLNPNQELSSLKELGVEDSSFTKFHDFYKPGESMAQHHLTNWLKKIKDYQSNKDFPSQFSTSRLSPYIAQGVISPRVIVQQCMDQNKGKRTGGDKGTETFIKEVAWRDFYRHVIVNWPFLMMFIPFNFSSVDLKWDTDYTKFEKWCMGETGFPIVDAAMKQLLHTGYMNNRCRMIVSSFLTKDLAIDWRIGERWFYNHLVDADCISNIGGWGFSSSTGLDAQPWFRIFNVYTQSEKFDPKGEFILEWLPFLKKLENIHQPYNEKSDHAKVEKLTNGYPKPIIDRKQAREDTLERYRDVM